MPPNRDLVGDGDVDAQHSVDGLVVALERLHEASVLDARHPDLPLHQLRLSLHNAIVNGNQMLDPMSGTTVSCCRTI